MKQLLFSAVFAALAMAGTAGAAQALCIWSGNHWTCDDRYIYPKTYPWGTWNVDGTYARPMSPPESDVTYPPIPPGR